MTRQNEKTNGHENWPNHILLEKAFIIGNFLQKKNMTRQSTYPMLRLKKILL